MNNPVGDQARSHSVWLLEIVTSGQLEMRVNESDWLLLNPGDGLLHSPGTCYYERTPRAKMVCYSIGLMFDVSEPLPQGWERFHKRYLQVQDGERLLTSLVERTLHSLGLGGADDLLANGYFLMLMAQLLQAELQNQTLIVAQEYSGDGDMVSLAHRYMRARLDKSLTIAEIAAEVGMSMSGFAHAYKRQTGASPMVALRQMRVEAIKSHLLRDRLSLAQIANETGFADAFHLSRTFKQATGVSPRQFRQSLLNKKSP